MGTFVGHIVPGFALFLLGLWHTINTIRAYHLKGSTNFVSRFWYPFKSSLFKLDHLELIFIFSFSLFTIIMQLLDYPFLHFSFKLHNFEHATMFLHLAIFAGFTLLAELTHLSETLFGVSGILATSVFCQELFLLHYHSTDHVGLEGHYHWLLQLIVFISIISALCTTCSPTSFLSALVLSLSVVFQGCWFMNMGFMLWDPRFVPQGCVVKLGDETNEKMLGAVICETREAEMTARALANLQFSWVLAGILVCNGFMCLLFAKSAKPRVCSTEYKQLQNRGIDASVAITGSLEAQ